MNTNIKVKITHPYGEFPLIRQTPNTLGNWGDCDFFVNQQIPECDYWFIIDDLVQEERVVCNPKNVYIFTLEFPSIRSEINSDFLNQFSTVITYSRNLNHPNIIEEISLFPWHLGIDNTNSKTQQKNFKTYDQLILPIIEPKSKLISVISSNKSWTEGHKKRLKFVEALKDHYGDKIDIFGRGIRDFADKWDAIVPYKYHIAIENSACHNGISEKLYDAFLGESFPIYYGSPNVRDYFSEESFLDIDINNIDESIKRIDNLLLNNTYEKSIFYIRESKDLVLNKYNLFPFICDLCEASPKSINRDRQSVNLLPESSFLPQKKIKVNHLKFYITKIVKKYFNFVSFVKKTIKN